MFVLWHDIWFVSQLWVQNVHLLSSHLIISRILQLFLKVFYTVKVFESLRCVCISIKRWFQRQTTLWLLWNICYGKNSECKKWTFFLRLEGTRTCLFNYFSLQTHINPRPLKIRHELYMKFWIRYGAPNCSQASPCVIQLETRLWQIRVVSNNFWL